MQDDRVSTIASLTDVDHPAHDHVAEGTIELAEERLQVGKVERVTGRVRVGVVTETVNEPVSLDLTRMETQVDRVEIDRMLEPGETPPVQTMRGETTVIPILEEVLVVEKRLVLKAELHMTPVTSTETVSTTVELRRQVATIDRLPADPPTDAGVLG